MQKLSGGRKRYDKERPMETSMTDIQAPTVIEASSPDANPTLFVYILSLVPRALASRVHIVFLFCLMGYLVILPVLDIYTPGPQAMLIGGNWTNITGDLGACIAAGGTITILHRQKKNHQERLDQVQHHHEEMKRLLGK